MKRLAWIAAALVMATGSAVISGWPALQELRRSKTWETDRVETSLATLGDVQIRIDKARTLSFKSRPDRTVIWLRLGVQGDGETLQSWLGCNLALVDTAGRRWLPLASTTGSQIIDLLAGEKVRGSNCGQAAYQASQSGTEAISDEAFLVPSDVAAELRVEMSGFHVRTRVVSMPLNAERLPDL